MTSGGSASNASTVSGLAARLDPANVFPIVGEFRRYHGRKFRADLTAAATVAVISIPQAVGFALIAGLPVSMVLTCVIVGGIACACFNSSRHLVFGPTNTISIILAGTLIAGFPAAANPLALVVALGFLIGVIQLAAGLIKMGNLTHFISRSVIIGYSTGVGVLIASGQLSNLFGMPPPEAIDVISALGNLAIHLGAFDFNPYSLALGAACLLLLIALRRQFPRWPDGLIVLVFSGGFASVFSIDELGVTLIRDTGLANGGGGIAWQGVPLDASTGPMILELGGAAVAIAILGMLEAVSIAKTLAARSGQKIDPNRELVGMGMGNLLTSAFGGMPGSSSFVRSAVNYQSGGRTQVATLLSSGLVLALVMFAAPLAAYIPIPALAAMLIMVAVRLINPEHIRVAVRATKSDAAVFGATFGSTLFLNLDTAIYVGIGVSLALFLKKASAPILVEYSFNPSGNLMELEDKAERANPAISIIHVEGELFFGAADLFQDQVRYLADDEDIRVFVLRMKNARHLDATSIFALQQLLDYLRNSDRHLLISGISPDVERVLRNSALMDKLGEQNVFRAEANPTVSTRRALLRAIHLLQTDSPEIRLFYDRTRKEERARADGEPPPAPDYEI